MRLAILALTMVRLSASMIAPGPVWSGLPEFQAPCDGYTLGLPPFGCITGEIRTISAAGEVLTGYLKPTPYAEPAPILPPAIVPPVIVEKTVVDFAATPEPTYRDGLVVIAAGVILWRLIRGEVRTGGGK